VLFIISYRKGTKSELHVRAISRGTIKANTATAGIQLVFLCTLSNV